VSNSSTPCPLMARQTASPERVDAMLSRRRRARWRILRSVVGQGSIEGAASLLVLGRWSLFLTARRQEEGESERARSWRTCAL